MTMVTMATSTRKMAVAYCVLVMTWTLQQLPGGTALDPSSTSSWRLAPTMRCATGDYEMSVKARSTLDCVRKCEKYSFCYSLVFDDSSGTCYLNARLHSNPPADPLKGQAYVKPEPNCLEDDAPFILNGEETWTRTLTSFRSDVTCLMYYMNTTAEVFVQCLRDGTWMSEGECIRYVWINPSLSLFPLDLPFPIVGDWALCLEGYPTASVRFTIDLIINETAHALHADFRFRFSIHTEKMLLKYRLGKDYPDGLTISDWPFVVQKSFKMKIKVTKKGYFQLIVNGDKYGTYPQQAGLPATDVTSVKISNYVRVTKLNLWC